MVVVVDLLCGMSNNPRSRQATAIKDGGRDSYGIVLLRQAARHAQDCFSEAKCTDFRSCWSRLISFVEEWRANFIFLVRLGPSPSSSNSCVGHYGGSGAL